MLLLSLRSDVASARFKVRDRINTSTVCLLNNWADQHRKGWARSNMLEFQDSLPMDDGETRTFAEGLIKADRDIQNKRVILI